MPLAMLSCCDGRPVRRSHERGQNCFKLFWRTCGTNLPISRVIGKKHRLSQLAKNLFGLRAPAQGKFVTLGVTRGCIEVASPVSSITWLIAP